jgi:hypothetical protein
MKSLSLAIQKIWLMLIFKKVGQTSRSKSQGQKYWYQKKSLVKRKTHMKYESPITSHSKDMAKVKVFEKRDKLQGQGQTFWYQ